MHWIDPDSLPEIRGRVDRVLVNPHGDPDGLILADGAEVHFPPHMGAEAMRAFEAAPQSEVKIRGLKPRGADVFAAVSLEWPDGERIEDRGPPEKRHKPGGKHPPGRPHHPDKAHGGGNHVLTGTVRRALHGPKGERRGVLLETGEIVRFPPHAGEDTGELLTPGAKFAARGEFLQTPYGAVMEAAFIGEGEKRLRPIEKPKPHRD